jgi:acyl-CoA reductase-like NAD-dependent aldehyde dehydrogenase
MNFSLGNEYQAMDLKIEERLRLLQDVAARLARRREELVAAAGEDIGTPCTVAGLEVDLAVEHLQTMSLETLYVEASPLRFSAPSFLRRRA